MGGWFREPMYAPSDGARIPDANGEGEFAVCSWPVPEKRFASRRRRCRRFSQKPSVRKKTKARKRIIRRRTHFQWFDIL